MVLEMVLQMPAFSRLGQTCPLQLASHRHEAGAVRFRRLTYPSFFSLEQIEGVC